ncbi:MAG: hypothetical protein HY063_06215 [Bacteroidetes bacterium]|nr:hypothetical protein [Bacteroidota bacterium]
MIGILLAIFYTAVFIFLIRKLSFFSAEGISKNAFTFAFLVKIIFGFGFWALYSYYSRYQNRADAFLYFDDGKILYSALFKNPVDYIKLLLGFNDASLNPYIEQTGYWLREFNQGLYNETRTVIRFNALVCLFSFGNYHVHTVFMCFISFTGLAGIYKTFLPYLKNKKRELFIAVFFIPSVLFWGSGVLKEGLILFSMGMSIYLWFKLLQEKFSLLRFISLLIFLWLLAASKIYVLLIILPALIAHTWIVKSNKNFSALKYSAVLLLYVSAGLLLPHFDFPFMLFEKQRQSIYLSRGGSYLENEQAKRFIYIKSDVKDRIIPLKDKPGYCKIKPGVPYLKWTLDNYLDTGKVYNSIDTTTYWIFYNQEGAGSRIDIPVLFPSAGSLLKTSPLGFFISLFRPHLLEAKNPLMLFSAVENFFILLFILLCLFFHKINSENFHLFLFCVTIVILLYTLVGITTAILGSAVRYKMPALPFLFIAMLLILDKEKLLNKFPFLRKILA